MISNAAEKYLWDAQRAAERITRFTAGRTFDDYLADEMLSAAVERQFEIIGEALVRLRRIAPEGSAMIPDVAEIIGFRNVLAHDYDDIDSRQVWGTIENEQLLRSAPPP